VKFELQKLSYRELLDLSDKVTAAIEARKLSEKSDIKNKVRELVESAGFDIDEIVGKTGSGKSLKGRKVAPKYRNPKKPGETWSGRGRQPKWLAAELARGKTLGSFLIK
jgi:DNA-binding protein H-NS